jgi:hypothetical protein
MMGRRGGTIVSIPVALLVFSMLLASQFSPMAVTAGSLVPKTPTSVAQTATLAHSVFLRRGWYQGFELDSVSNDTTATYTVLSSAPISTALMTGAQYNVWANGPSDSISNSVTYQNGTSVQNTVTIQPGHYFLVLYAYLTRALVEFGYQVNPSTPFSYGPISQPLASGIASFGISNSSGTVTSYEVKTSQIVGLAKISSLQVNTPDAYSYGVLATGATLQLNAMLVVNDNGSSAQKVYWVQNVPDFVTAASQVSFGDEIWNSTDTSGYLSNQTVTSTNLQNGGAIYSAGGPGVPGSPFVYNYDGNNQTYNLPLDFAILMKATVLPGAGVVVQLGYRLLSNGSAVAFPTNWFDNVTIHDSRVQTAYFDVTGNATTPDGHYFDAELVFAGEGNFESAHFAQLNATLGLFYQNANGQLSSYPTYYGFSGDTGESADDLVVTYVNGIAQVASGANPNYSYLGSGSLVLDPNTMTVSSSTAS